MGKRAQRLDGWTVGRSDGEEPNKGGQQGGVLKDELWLEGRCWSWSWKYGLANEICWSAKWENIVDTEEEQNSLLERLGWAKC